MARRSYWVGRAALLAATAAVSLVLGRAFAEDAVLLTSTVPGYVPGMVISATDRLSVPEGASATLLFQSGEMMRLGGPFEGTLGQQQVKATGNGVAMLADLFRLHGVDATMIGGTRSTNMGRSGPSIDDVLIDAQRSGTYCVEPSTSVWITRPTGDPRMYAVRRKGSTRTLGWPSGAERVEWPADVPIEDGSQFEIATDGAARATVTFRAMPSTVGPGPATVATGILLGCREQFNDELRRVSRSAARPELWMTSDHGRRPTYHQGEPVALTVMADTDGYLYCVAAKDDGTATPIFPAGAVDGAQVRGSVALSIPGRRQPVGLTAASGLEQIRCWLADRDITPELPHALLGSSTGRIPDQLAGDLDGLFSHIGGTRIEADVLTVKTE
jgi:Domain of unknown function (DUF4384)